MQHAPQFQQQINQFVASLPQLLVLGLTVGAARGMMGAATGAPVRLLPHTKLNEWEEHLRSELSPEEWRAVQELMTYRPQMLPQTVVERAAPSSLEEVERRVRNYADSLWRAVRNYERAQPKAVELYYRSAEKAIASYRRYVMEQYRRGG